MSFALKLKRRFALKFPYYAFTILVRKRIKFEINFSEAF